MHKILLLMAAVVFVAGCAASGGMAKDTMDTHSFTVTVMVSPESPTPLAPVAWAVHTGENPILKGDMMMGAKGLEALAEDGDPSQLAETLSHLMEVKTAGVASIPEGNMEAGPVLPGHAYTFTFEAAEGARLSLATMFVQSNDLFFGPGAEGIALYEMGKPVSGDITDRIMLFDAGTEVNEEPAMGAHQPPRQMGPNMGSDEMGTVRPVSEVMDGFAYPMVDKVLRITIQSM